MPSIPLQRTLAIGSLVYAATLWGLVWYPYRLLNEAGVGGIASSFFTYAVPLLALGWLHGRELHRARARWLWLSALGLAAGWTNLAFTCWQCCRARWWVAEARGLKEIAADCYRRSLESALRSESRRQP